MQHKPDVNIRCPNCDTAIDVDQILYQQLEDDIKKKYQSHLAELKKDMAQKENLLQNKQRQLVQKEKDIEDKIQQSVQLQLSKEKAALQSKLKKQLELENEAKIKLLEQELLEKSKQAQELNLTKSELEKIKREKAELREVIELENQQKITELLQSEKEKIAKREAEKNFLKIAEKEKVIEQLKEQLSEASRKAEQGSMQLQGEVQELAIEEWLSQHFPLDNIIEIKKGQRGGDCLQVVNTRLKQNCGSIYYESKRTKDFQPSWIEKFRNDMREKNAELGVLVTDAMPKDMKRMGLREGIWICNYQEFKGLCFVLREHIVALENAIASQENKGDKMHMLYDFLTSNEFKLQIEAIVEGFTQMQEDLNREKRSIMGHWKKREKQIQKVLLNTNFMYSSIKGIAGSAIQPIKQLDLPLEDENSPEPE